VFLKYAVKDFLSEKEFGNLSPNTVIAYRYTLDGFTAFCLDRKVVYIGDVRPKDIRDYLYYCKTERGNGPVSINHKLNNLRIFFKYLVKTEIITDKQNPAKNIDFLRTDYRINVFSDDQIKQILNYFQRQQRRGKNFYAFRDYMIVIILLGTGMRLGELVNLTWHSINIENGAGTLTVYGKKRRDSSIPVTEKLKKELCTYRVYLEKTFGRLPEHVITDRRGHRLTEGAVKCVFKRLKKVFDFPGVRLSAHTFRHCFAHAYITAGGDAFSLQKILRHSNISTTEKYVQLWDTALKEQNDKFNPLNRINF